MSLQSKEEEEGALLIGEGFPHIDNRHASADDPEECQCFLLTIESNKSFELLREGIDLVGSLK